MTQSDPDSGWHWLYKVAGVAAVMAALVFRRHFAAELTLLMNMGIIRMAPRSSVLEWFALLQGNRFLGLLMLDLFDIIEYLL
jgi:hypothetical protein